MSNRFSHVISYGENVTRPEGMTKLHWSRINEGLGVTETHFAKILKPDHVLFRCPRHMCDFVDCSRWHTKISWLTRELVAAGYNYKEIITHRERGRSARAAGKERLAPYREFCFAAIRWYQGYDG